MTIILILLFNIPIALLARRIILKACKESNFHMDPLDFLLVTLLPFLNVFTILIFSIILATPYIQKTVDNNKPIKQFMDWWTKKD